MLRCLATLGGHEARVWHLSWHPGGHYLATCGEDQSVRIWERQIDSQWNCIATIKEHRGTVRSVDWSPRGSALATASFDRKAVIMDVLPANGPPHLLVF